MGTLTVPQRSLSRSPYLEWGVADAAMMGQQSSGDLHVVCARGDGAVVAVVDGLGHGPEAQVAAQRAVATIDQHCDQSVISLIRLCHKALIGTRGVAMSIASFNALDDTLTWLAIGNVEGVLLRADPMAQPARESVVMRGGVIGYELPIVRAAVTVVAPGDLLVFATDGIESSFTDQLSASRPPQRLADQILAEHGKGTDDALVFVARYLGRTPTRT
jgi:negative regulator of sigma-B (phosphoserine phosphatase)